LTINSQLCSSMAEADGREASGREQVSSQTPTRIVITISGGRNRDIRKVFHFFRIPTNGFLKSATLGLMTSGSAGTLVILALEFIIHLHLSWATLSSCICWRDCRDKPGDCPDRIPCHQRMSPPHARLRLEFHWLEFLTRPLRHARDLLDLPYR